MKLINNLGEALSQTPTPWAVHCECSTSLVFMTKAAYDLQMARPDSLWKCPRCGQAAEWDDENFEKQSEVE